MKNNQNNDWSDKNSISGDWSEISVYIYTEKNNITHKKIYTHIYIFATTK